MMLVLIVLSTTCLCIYCLLIFKWNAAWNKIPEVNPGLIEPLVKITVIIPVRNEAGNISTVLNSMLNQSYPAHLFQVIVSDDHSDDNTVQFAKDFFLQHADINGLVMESHNAELSSKKEALKKAIEMATGELIVTTDADCNHTKEWLQSIASYFVANLPVMICGPVIMRGNQTFLQQFQALDYLSLQVCGAASLSLSKPLLCSGANLAFARRAFYDVNGYDDNLQHASGDDTFLMLKMHQRFPGKVHFLKSKDAIVTTCCSSSLREFMQQRFRWMSKTKQYSSSYIKGLGSFILLINLFFVLILFSGSAMFCLALSYLLIKTFADYFFLSNTSGFFNIRISKFSFLLMEIVYPFYLVALVMGFLRGSYHWKQRKHHS